MKKCAVDCNTTFVLNSRREVECRILSISRCWCVVR